MELTYDFLAKRIDHSLLAPQMTDAEIADGCRLAARYRTASVCVKPHAVVAASSILSGTGVAVGTTVGFPHGGHATAVKVFETRRAVVAGAVEIDMVINIGWALGGQWSGVKDDIFEVTRAARDGGALVKVIFENCYLNDDQKTRLCHICGEVGADYVKTSTGYGTGGATHDDLRLMRRESPARVKVKAAGGVRTLDAALAVVELGCDRIGASATAAILDAWTARLAGRPNLVPRETEASKSGY
ncbi:MAG: deoxyribose-phosphate aldolase [Planctomycetota bacterium]|nr:deoxyribose-phosphate aldolase [Planctomycetota bacterium]